MKIKWKDSFFVDELLYRNALICSLICVSGIFLTILFVLFNSVYSVMMGALSGFFGGVIGGTIGSYWLIPKSVPTKIGFSKNKLHLRFKNKFYNIDIEKSNIMKVKTPIMSTGRTLEIYLKTGPVRKIMGPKELLKEIIKNVNISNIS
jgi:hypothetical protein